MATSYLYSIQNDFPQSQVNPDLLTVEIQNSVIVGVLDHIDTAGDDCLIWFVNPLSGPDELELDLVVGAHSPAGAPPSVVVLESNVIIEGTWAVFREYIDGTIANLYFYTQAYSDRYVITSDYHGGFRHQYTLPFIDAADKTDYETNFAPIQDTRRPYEQLNFTNKNATITYSLSGDVDKIETIIGDKKRIDQYNYSGGELVGISTTLVDA